jgi:uncharacterized protein YjbI with pentapeptide repeats
MSYRAEIQRLLDTMPSDWKAQWAGARKQLRALDYDAPAVPDVDDAMQALYLTAGGNESGDPIKGPVPVPAAVRDEAMRALRMAHKNNYGAWNFIGVARAIQLAVVPRIGQKSVDRMRGFFTRHAKDAEAAGFGDDAHPSRGYLAHLVWGGDPAKRWVMDMEKRARKNPDFPDFLVFQEQFELEDLHRAQTGAKDLRKAKLEGADLQGLDLRNVDLSEARLTSANLQGADLRGANLSSAYLYKADFRNADLSEANLFGSQLDAAAFHHARLVSADLRHVQAFGATFFRADLTGAFVGRASFVAAYFKDADLTGINFTTANLTDAKFGGAKLTDAEWTADQSERAVDLPKPPSATKAEQVRAYGRLTGPVLKTRKHDAPVSAAAFKKRYPAEFERLKGETKGRDFTESVRADLEHRTRTPYDWYITQGKYHNRKQRYCADPNKVWLFNLDLDRGDYTERQKELLTKLSYLSAATGHPTAAAPYYTVGWVRLCVNEEAKTVLIEEVQSDVSVVRKKLKNGTAPEAWQAYADVLDDLAPIADRFYADVVGYVFMEAEKQGYTVEMLDYAAKQGFGSPRELYTDLPRSMGMRLGEVSKVVPEVGKAWSYKPNPARVRRNPTARADTDTPAFRRWFGDSKVVDKHGRPRVMYHGTSEDFSVFDTSGTRRSKQIGAMFTPSKAYAANYGRKDTGGRVLACYLRIERPFDAKNKQHNREWEANRRGLEGWTEYARRVGYDGAITMLNEYVVFDPHQIKSVDNRGTFDPTDPDIRHNPRRARYNPRQARKNGDDDDYGYEEPPARNLLMVDTDTPAFRRWFGDSKVITAYDTPRVVYHGSPWAGFSKFRSRKVHYFTDDSNIAATYTGTAQAHEGIRPFLWEGPSKPKPGIYMAYLKIERPLVVDAQGRNYDNIPPSSINFDPKVVAKVLRRRMPSGVQGWETDDIAKIAKYLGYDGVVFKRIRDEGGDVEDEAYGNFGPSTVYAVFEPRQIKSATGNRGTFDPADPDIRHNPRHARRSRNR